MDQKKKILLNQAYQEFVEIGLNIRPILDELKHLIDPNIMGFGTTEDERIFSRQDFIDLIKRQEEQAVGIKLEHQIKPVHRRVLNGENSAIYVDDLIMRITTDSGQFEMKMRFSIVLEYLEEKWVVVHWHGSKPEEVKSEEDTWGIAIWKKKTEELERLVAEKTADLVAKNRELEIEAALERVRARTMAMHDSIELEEVAVLMYREFLNLGFESVQQCGYAIINEYKGLQNMWLTQFDGNRMSQFFLPLKSDALLTERYKAWKSDLPNFYQKTSKSDFLKHLQKVKSGIDPEQVDIARKNMPDPIHFYNAHFTHGYLHIVANAQLSKDQESILIRCAKVFEQTYTRFLDLQKAEEQAREAQIEAALERVRARAMAMHSSKELEEVALELRVQMGKLGQKDLEVCAIHLYEEDEDYFESWGAVRAPGMEEKLFQGMAKFPKSGIKIVEEMMSHYYAGDKDYVLVNDGEKGQEWLLAMKKYSPQAYAMLSKKIDSTRLEEIIAYWSISDFKGGALVMVTYTKPDETSLNLLRRAANVFQLAYRRYLDLQKAEDQAREAQIEAALEKVRSRSLAMHKSDELNEVVSVLFEKLKELQVPFTAVGIAVGIEGSKDMNAFVCGDNEDGLVITNYLLPYFNNPVPKDLYRALEQQLDFFEGNYSKKDKDAFYHYIIENTAEFKFLPEDVKQMIFDSQAYSISMMAVKNAVFNINDFEGKSLKESDIDIIKRFARVFDQAYTRFLDLKKAEAQAREGEIQLALERVRARTMAMQKSEELADAAFVLFEQLRALGGNLWGTGFGLCQENVEKDEFWFANENGVFPPVSIPNTSDPAHRQMYLGWQEKTDILTIEKSGASLKSHYDYMLSLPEVRPFFQKILDEGLSFPEKQQWNAAYFSKGYLLVITLEPYPEPEIFKRFANVFEQTYTRFLDLQKAEAQAREAEIQLALERIRARSMAMQSSDELHDVLSVLFRQFDHLGIHPMNVYLSLFDRENRTLTYRASGKSRHRQPQKQVVNVDSMTELKAIYDKFINDQSDSVEVIFYSREVLPQVFEIFSETFDALPEDERMKMEYFPEGGFSMAGYTPFGYLGYDHQRPASEEEKEILSRFCNEFTRVYQRFLDIQKAEAQAREAQIEAALERVRSRTLAMQKSDELAETAAILFQQLIQLGIEPNRLYIGIIKDNSSQTEFWTTEEDGSKISTAYTTDLLNNPSFTKMYEGWKRKEKSTVVDIKGEELKEYIDYLTSLNIPFKDGKKQTRRIQYLAYFAKGFIGMASPDEQPRESMEILERFAYAFNLTFTRFNDLKVAEAQARQAQIEVALERVRARALAMQEPEELKEVATVLRQEMGALGVEELETSSIYIHDPGSDLSECWYAIRDIRKGKTKLVSDHFALNLPETWVGQQMLKFFESSQSTTSIVMTGNNRVEWIRYCEKNSKPLQGYYGQEIPDRTYHLYKFSHGAIGAASAGDISKESWDLLKRAATAFSLAYSRFKDLTQARIDLIRLKEAKQKAESALAELKSAQSQLIQAEKMASLGELTAGIAHEIQNPLNFVNNFSEVSGELIDEAQGEIEKGDLEEIKFILQDLKDNLSKINHHGKRAGSIVKGMLEHSRKSEGKKELTDLNQLADECLRLSFHGLRAKDKTFSADFKTDFDSDLPKLEVVSQDMGRVLLNLINNAFYAVNEKAKGNIKGYKPEVIVSTKKTNSGIEISVSDNGSGIPDSIKDKIFQPFFTTKPTGSGTGLGLSLSYDIVKAHGGDFKVKSKEGEGTVFSVYLPKQNI